MSSAQTTRVGMPRLHDRLRITSLTLRDRCAMICAVGAVACLSSLIANWSRQFPVEHSSWEQNLFSNLGNVETQETTTPAPSADLLPSTPPETAFPGDLRFGRTVHADATTNSVDSILAVPITDRPPESRPRFIEPVNYQEREDIPSVWLSGGIETETDDDDASLQSLPDPTARSRSSSGAGSLAPQGINSRHSSPHSRPAR